MKKGAISILSVLTGAVLGAGVVGKMTGESVDKSKNMSDKHLALFLMMNQWVKVKQEGKNVAEYFKKNGFHRIAIYGMSYVGETLVDELKDSDIEVVYGIDRNADTIYSDVDIILPESNLEKTDAIIVTAISFFDEIEQNLSEKVDCPIISMEDVLYEV